MYSFRLGRPPELQPEVAAAGYGAVCPVVGQRWNRTRTFFPLGPPAISPASQSPSRWSTRLNTRGVSGDPQPGVGSRSSSIPDPASHTFTAPSRPPEISRPSGVNASAVAAPPWAVQCPTSAPVPRSKIRTDPSAIRSPVDDTLLITADQVVVYEGVIREKPESDAEARAFIAGYGVAPAVTTQDADARNVRGVTTTSSPWPTPIAFSATSSARVPFASATA